VQGTGVAGSSTSIQGSSTLTAMTSQTEAQAGPEMQPPPQQPQQQQHMHAGSSSTSSSSGARAPAGRLPRTGSGGASDVAAVAGGSTWRSYRRRLAPSCKELMYVCNGDRNGVIHYIATGVQAS
jgi:hypothetical protein